MNRSEQAHGILEEHVRQLHDSGNELYDNSNESYVRLERFHGLVRGELRELLAIKMVAVRTPPRGLCSRIGNHLSR